MKVKVDIVTSDDIKIYYTGKFQDFTPRYIIKRKNKFGCKIEILFGKSRKILLEKRKMQVICIFSISHNFVNVFFFPQGQSKTGLC